ncbi:lipopolysaccharide kinase InaA family protein [Aromatoleum diolicum]|uniref:Heptose kinase n=1 Tax=Aromatoleum diolicum TaxID=75796 RepID=A0ABX1QFI7_9RHOO|nr:lipopolysaccharide kinase InaA family protein [Aromatoleum diolicum]NMG77198.1 heptose kinase [Aromatoleum diolicum]
MSAWTLNADYLRASGSEAELRQHFGSLDAVFALAGQRVARDPLSEVLKVDIAGRNYYVKRYHGAGKHLRRWLGRPRVKAEWENLRHFAAWGIPTATVVAWGMERRAGAFHRGALITAELARTTDLAQLANTHDPRLTDRRWVAAVSRQLAQVTRRMHAQRFTHNDLKWRNLLVDDAIEPQLYLIDCPGGDFWRGPLLRYRIVKDLACLDKVAKYHLTRTQRLRFYLDYAGKRRLDAADKRRVRRITDFFAGRE